ncbi:glycosyl transferase [Marinitoga piezophila KA3]|uniref:Glycosyl transferase n=1 Tax=Marinitoga piezophila (strain DSM 14283 / JCM 11233 / KA3) TaxID=443254 RepID=H2J2T5_MARPK|nr:glycosyltransferase [Marinitoga piezophila]AEX84529.1 glycosyl transferase [Marinitoga piezophila KA3]
MKKGLISACIMAKNEEQNITRCLESIKDFCDEIIFVDTGSTDNTVEIAKKYTDKIYFFPWNGNFSDARNETLKYATSEWVFIVDADEEASEKLKNNIRSFLENLEKDIVAVYIPTINYMDFDKKTTEIASTARFFRNGKVKYENIVHNQPIYKGKQVKVDFPLYHYGYIWTRLRRKQKTERTLALIEKYLKENPNDIYYLIQYMKTLSIANKYIEKMKIGKKVAEMLSEKLRKGNYKPIPMEVEFMFLWGVELMNKGYWEDAIKWFNIGTKWNLDCYYGLMNVYYNKRDWKNLKQVSLEFIKYLNIFENRKSEITWSMQSLFKKNEGIIYLALSKIKESDFNKIEKIIEEIDYQKNTNKILTLLEITFDTFISAKTMKEKEIILYILEKLIEGIPNNIQYYPENHIKWIKRIKTFFDNLKNDPYEFLIFLVENFENEKNIVGLLLSYGDNLFELRDYEKVLKTFLKIRRLRREASDKEKGVIELLIGDALVKMGRFNEAKNKYKKAVEFEKSLAKFVQVLIEDILTQMNPEEIIPAYIDLRDEMNQKIEMIFELKSFNKNELSIYDYYLGKVFIPLKFNYALKISYNKEFDEAYEKILLQIFDSIKDNKKFKAFIGLRLYHYYRKNKKFKNAKKYLLSALELNPIIADLKGGHYNYTGFYYEKNIEETEDKIIDVVNLGEIMSLLPVVNPVRCWYESENKGIFYVSPQPEYNSIYALDKFLKKFTNYFDTIFQNPLNSNELKYNISRAIKGKTLEINTKEKIFVGERITIENNEYIEDRKIKEIYDSIIYLNPEYSRNIFEDIKYLKEKFKENLILVFNLDKNLLDRDPRVLNIINIMKLDKFIETIGKPYESKIIADKYLYIHYKK